MTNEPEASPEELLRALADPDRLAIAGALAKGPRTAQDLAGALGLTPSAARRHAAKLAAVGVVAIDADRRTYHLRPETLRQAALRVGPAREPGLALGAIDEEEETVLRHYFVGGRLRELPAKHTKRMIVLTRLALDFEPGVRYREAEVNAQLKRYHVDYASLRRALVDEGLLSRAAGSYWRSGGPVEV
jgi:hypothetical protein